MNNRYQKGTTPKGASRKSAASAKPKRPAGEKPKLRETTKKAATKKGDNGSWLREMPDTPEYKKYRRWWWYSLGISVVFLAISLPLSMKSDSFRQTLGLSSDAGKQLGLWLSWVALAFVAFSWWLDFKKIRPIVKDGDKASDAKAAKTEKVDKKVESDKKEELKAIDEPKKQEEPKKEKAEPKKKAAPKKKKEEPQKKEKPKKEKESKEIDELIEDLKDESEDGKDD